jgi:hypothetical protein
MTQEKANWDWIDARVTKLEQSQAVVEEKTSGPVEVASLRDYYAARILQGLVEKHGASYLYETIREAFRMADAAMVIREEKTNG